MTCKNRTRECTDRMCGGEKINTKTLRQLLQNDIDILMKAQGIISRSAQNTQLNVALSWSEKKHLTKRKLDKNKKKN